MNARGRVVSSTGMIHLSTCGMVIGKHNTTPLSAVPAPKRNKLSKCRICKP